MIRESGGVVSYTGEGSYRFFLSKCPIYAQDGYRCNSRPRRPDVLPNFMNYNAFKTWPLLIGPRLRIALSISRELGPSLRASKIRRSENFIIGPPLIGYIRSCDFRTLCKLLHGGRKQRESRRAREGRPPSESILFYLSGTSSSLRARVATVIKENFFNFETLSRLPRPRHCHFEYVFLRFHVLAVAVPLVAPLLSLPTLSKPIEPFPNLPQDCPKMSD
jgi:hypothetical protein